MGEPLTSTEVKNSTEFLRLQDQYKGEIVEDKRLTKAAELAAKQHMILKNNQDDGMKEARLRVSIVSFKNGRNVCVNLLDHRVEAVLVERY